MAERSPDAQRVFEAAFDKVAEMGLELVDAEMVREGQRCILRLYIDKPGGVDLEDCSRVSRMIDPIIDNDLQLHRHHFLEVSSPGLERPLRTSRDFARYCGEWVEVILYRAQDGRKKYQGILGPSAPEAVDLILEDQSKRTFLLEQVAKVQRIIRY